LRRAGIDALVRALGPVGMARFLPQFDSTYGDYTADRDVQQTMSRTTLVLLPGLDGTGDLFAPVVDALGLDYELEQFAATGVDLNVEKQERTQK
jgi:hypothetical protein